MRWMMRFLLGVSLFIGIGAGLTFATPTVSPSTVTASSISDPVQIAEPPETEQPFSAQDGDLMPTSAYTVKKPYDQAHDILQKAVEAWKQNQALKASDTALEAYDDLMEVHLPRRPKSARKKLRAERYLAAQLYIDSSIAFIKQDAVKAGSTAAAKLEARQRLGDLRDVSREYLDLQKEVVNTIMELQ